MADGGDPGATLQRLIDGHRISQAIHAAAVLGIADAIGEQARGVSEIAAATACDGPSLHRLLRALAAVGVLHEGEDGRFTLTPVGACLCAGAPRARAAWASLAGVASVRAAWGALAAGVRTGTTPFVTVHGHDVWTHRSGLAGESAIFDAAMREAAARAAPGILAAGGFARFRRIVDVGGGDGALIAAILRACPDAEGVLVDLAHVVAGAAAVLRDARVADRCRVVAGDMFAGVPAGDAIVVKAVLHDWDDGSAAAILTRCRAALAPGGVVLVVERVLAPPNEGAEGKLADLNMLVMTGGRERTRAEFAALLASAGLVLDAVRPAGGPLSVLEARPAE